MRGVAQPELAVHEDFGAARDGCAIVIVPFLPGVERPEDRIMIVIPEHARFVISQRGHAQCGRSARLDRGPPKMCAACAT